MNKKRMIHLAILGGLTFAICLCIYLPFLVEHVPLQYGTDIKTQWYFFYEEFKNLIMQCLETKSLPFYSWSLFLGTNFFASKSYYLMGDLFNYVSLFFQNNFFEVAMWMTIAKIVVASYTCYYFLTQWELNFKTKLIGSLCYAMSAWAIFYSGQLAFLSFYCWMPLYFSGIELYLKKNKKLLFMLSCSLLLFTNFYFFFTLSLFTVLYYIYRYSLLRDNYKNFIKETSILIGYYLIGVMITGLLTLPTILYIMGNDRVGTLNSFTAFYDQARIYFHLLVSSLVPNYLYIYQANVFETTWHVTREICMWTGCLTIIFLPQLFTDQDKKFKRNTLLFYGILILIMIIPSANSVMHGFSDPSLRWLMLWGFMNILLACRYLGNPQLIHKKNLRMTCLCFSLLMFIIIPLTAWWTGQTVDFITQFSKQWMIFSIFGLVYCFYFFLLSYDFCWRTPILVICIVVELTGSGMYLMENSRNKENGGTYDFLNRLTHVLEDQPGQLNQFLLNIEPENHTQYYRTYVSLDSLYWSYSHNMSLNYQLQGLMTYDSTYAPSLTDLRNIAPQIKDYDSSWIFNITDPNLIQFLNVKYAIVATPEELPDGNWRLLTDRFRSSFYVYRNDDYRPLATTYAKVITQEEYTQNFNNDLTMLQNTIVAKKEDSEIISSYLQSKVVNNLENIHYGSNALTANLTSDDTSFMVLTLPFDQGWKVMVNGEVVTAYQVNGGFMGIPVQAGNNRIEMYFIPQGFKAGCLLSGLGVGLACLVGLVELLKRKRAIK